MFSSRRWQTDDNGKKGGIFSMRLFRILLNAYIEQERVGENREGKREKIEWRKISLNQQMAGGLGVPFSDRTKVNFYTFPQGKKAFFFQSLFCDFHAKRTFVSTDYARSCYFLGGFKWMAANVRRQTAHLFVGERSMWNVNSSSYLISDALRDRHWNPTSWSRDILTTDVTNIWCSTCVDLSMEPMSWPNMSWISPKGPRFNWFESSIVG